jgi:caffeoyl-CoA O-methyltransferase
VASGTEHVTRQVFDYVLSHSSPPDPLLAELRAETARRFPASAGLQIGPEQGTFMTLVSQLVAPRRAVEVGTFTGYSAICLARGLAPGGSLLELRLGPAADTLRALPTDAPLDLAFIDADKTGYPAYWAEIVPRTRSGGVILVDNALLHGRIFAADPDPDARAVRDFTEQALADDRVELALLSIGDGVIFARKR